MDINGISRVTRRRFLKEAGLTLAAAGGVTFDFRAIRVAGVSRHQDAHHRAMEPLRP